MRREGALTGEQLRSWLLSDGQASIVGVELGSSFNECTVDVRKDCVQGVV